MSLAWSPHLHQGRSDTPEKLPRSRPSASAPEFVPSTDAAAPLQLSHFLGLPGKELHQEDESQPEVSAKPLPVELVAGQQYLVEPASAWVRSVSQLGQLLDFYFEPFSFQHNPCLLRLVARSNQPEIEGTWAQGTMLQFRCGLQSLGLQFQREFHLRHGHSQSFAALANLLELLHNTVCEGLKVKSLKHISIDWDGRAASIRLKTAIEVRSFVGTAGHLSQAEYLRDLTTPTFRQPHQIFVLSYVLDALAGLKELGRVSEQLMRMRADVVCLQASDRVVRAKLRKILRVRFPGNFQEICGALWAWDSERLTFAGATETAVRLRPVEAEDGPDISFAGIRASLENFDSKLLPATGPAVLCADLSLLGGADSFGLLADGDLRSVAADLLGREVSMPRAKGMEPVRWGEENELCKPEAMLYRGLLPVGVLSAHSERYLASLAPDELKNQLPALRLPLLACFDWRDA